MYGVKYRYNDEINNENGGTSNHSVCAQNEEKIQNKLYSRHKTLKSIIRQMIDKEISIVKKEQV